MKTPVATALLATLVAFAAGPAQAGPDWQAIEHARKMKPAAPPASVVVPAGSDTVAAKTLDLFVDLPTGFTFVRMPSGWKFVGKLESRELAKLPPSVLTSLLPREDAADIAKAEPAPKR